MDLFVFLSNIWYHSTVSACICDREREHCSGELMRGNTIQLNFEKCLFLLPTEKKKNNQMKSGDEDRRRLCRKTSTTVLRGFKALLQHLFLVQSIIFWSNTSICSGNTWNEAFIQMEIPWTFLEAFLKTCKKNLSACAFNLHRWQSEAFAAEGERKVWLFGALHTERWFDC